MYTTTHTQGCPVNNSSTYIRVVRLLLRRRRLVGGSGENWTLFTEGSNQHLDKCGEVTHGLEGEERGGREGRQGRRVGEGGREEDEKEGGRGTKINKCACTQQHTSRKSVCTWKGINRTLQMKK